MKNLCLFVFIALSLAAGAKTVQKGFVQEYNEKARKTPLAGVELNVRSAQSTVSSDNGGFTLDFLTLKPGERVNVRRIEKLGYEVFNKEAIEQWNINPRTPFVIIMCRADRFKKIRDNYERVSSESYAKQLAKEEKALAALKEKGEIQQAEYERQLFRLRENYERQLDNLESYVDRFSRIDLSELSDVEQEIIELVQQGKVDEAIAKYDEQHFVDKYVREVEQIKEVSSAIDQLEDAKQAKELSRDSLLAIIDRQVRTLRLGGGKDNFEKIGVILKDVYDADTLNIDNIRKYADYQYEARHYTDAIKLYLKIKDSYTTHDDIWQVRNHLVLSYRESELYGQALVESLELDSIIQANKPKYSSDHIIGTLLNRSLIYQKRDDVHKATECLEQALKSEEAKNCSPDVLTSVKNSLGNILCDENNLEEAITLYKEVYQFYKEHDDGSADSKENLAGSLLNIAQVYDTMRDRELAKEAILQSLNHIEMCYTYNPDKYVILYNQVLNTAGCIFSNLGLNDEAVAHYKKSIDIISPLYAKYPSIFWRDYTQDLTNQAILYTETNDFDNAVKLFEACLTAMGKAPKTNFRNKRISDTYYNLSYIYCLTEEFDKAIPLLQESLDYAKLLFNANKRYGARQYLNCTNNLAYCYNKTGKHTEAKEVYCNGKSVIEELELTKTAPFDAKYADFIYNIAHHAHHKEEAYPEAIDGYLKAYDIYSDLESENDQLQTIIGLAEAYLLSDNLDKAKEWIDKLPNKEKCESNIGWLHTRGLIACKDNNTEYAITCRNKILELKPDIDTEGMELFSLLKDRE